MSYTPFPLAVLYAGLAGTVLALIVATITNGWSLRVFFLLALRLTIGWHFLFEGLHKVHSYYTGPTDTNRVFNSEPYFRAAPGPIGERMRKEFLDTQAELAAMVKASESIAPDDFATLPIPEQAAKCPEAAARLIDANDMLRRAEEAIQREAENDLKSIKAKEDKDTKEIDAAVARAVAAARIPEDAELAKLDGEQQRAKIKLDAERARDAAHSKKENAAALAPQRIEQAKAAYTRWVYGVDPRPAQLPMIQGDLLLTAPQRLEHLQWLDREANDAAERQAHGLGNSTGTDAKRLADYRQAAITAEYDLLRDANLFIAELTKELNGGKEVELPRTESRGQFIDRATMWFLVIVGTLLLAGLLTRIACLAGVGFLVMTYLAHPPFPWYPLPPNTEGNPVFINKNIIEALALMVLVCYPTGRWLGLDALVMRCACWKRNKAAAS